MILRSRLWIHKLESNNAKLTPTSLDMASVNNGEFTKHYPELSKVPANIYSWAKWTMPAARAEIHPGETGYRTRDIYDMFHWESASMADLLRAHYELYITTGDKYLPPVLLSPLNDWVYVKPTEAANYVKTLPLYGKFSYANTYNIDIKYSEENEFEELRDITNWLTMMLYNQECPIYYCVAIAKYSKALKSNVVMIHMCYFAPKNKYAPDCYKSTHDLESIVDLYATDHVACYTSKKVRDQLRAELKAEQMLAKKRK